MSTKIGQSRWRRVAGTFNCFAGAFAAFISSTAAAAVFSNAGSDRLSATLWSLFFGGIAAALLWIGIGDWRGQARLSWIVRLALYLAILAITPPAIQVVREAIVKDRAIRNLKSLGEAVRKYEARYGDTPHLRPSAPPETAVEFSSPDD